MGTLVVLVALAGCDSGNTGAAPAAADAGPPPAPTTPAWFVDRTSDVGIDFRYETGYRGRRHLPEIMGAGAALLDVDGDGDLDVYFVNGGEDPATGVPGGDAVNRLFRQEADGRFVDVTAEAGVGDNGYGMGAAVGDVDNDGDPDLYVTNFGPDRLYRNRGDGTFEDVTEAAGIDVPGWSCSAAFLDYDGDGFLDLYVTQYVDFDPETECLNRAGEPIYCGPRAFPPVSDVLLRNAGDAGAIAFSDESEAAGISTVRCAGLGVICEDFDGDGHVDVYVANDAYANQLWLNGGAGTFTNVAVLYGVAYNMHGQPEAGMGVTLADFERRGRLDLVVTHLVGETNTLYRQHDDSPGFSDRTGPSGLGPSGMPMTGFGVAAFDADLDGDEDLAIVNGRVRRGTLDPGAAHLDHPWRLLAESNLFYLNDGAGRFEVAADEAGPLMSKVEISRALVAGDLDDDGDVDLVQTNINGVARVLYNEAPRQGAWLLVRAIDPALGRHAIGARVTVIAGDRRLTRTVRRATSYLSSGDPRVHFGLGDASSVDAIEVRWSGGERERFTVDGVDRVVEVRRGGGQVTDL